MYQRGHLQEILKRIKEPRKFLQVVVGPRQVGKTTLLIQLLENPSVSGHYCTTDGLPGRENTWIAEQWETARIRWKQQPKTDEFILIIDEIQKIENWSEAVKKEWDADSRAGISLKVILSGSSRVLIQQRLTESLTGRFELIFMGHWSFTEMHEAFGWDEITYAWFGGFPGSATLIEDEFRWKRYVIDSIIETSISRDILMLTRVDKPALMRKLFTLGSVYSGQVLSYTKLLGQLQDAGNTVTLSHYLDLLDQAGLLAGIEKFGSQLRQRSSSPKFQVYNTALLSAQLSNSFHEIQSNPSQWGRIVESAIGAHLLNSLRENKLSVYYWRQGDQEVDFILEKGEKAIAIEVKTGQTRKLTGMNAFIRQFHPGKMILISPDALTWQEFLKINPDQFF